MYNKTVFLVIVTALVGFFVSDLRAEYMEPHLYELRSSACDATDIEVPHDSYFEPTDERSAHEQQTRADDDPRVQSCIAEAIENKYCS